MNQPLKYKKEMNFKDRKQIYIFNRCFFNNTHKEKYWFLLEHTQEKEEGRKILTEYYHYSSKVNTKSTCVVCVCLIPISYL